MTPEQFNFYFPLILFGLILTAAITVRLLKALGILANPVDPVADAIRRSREKTERLARQAATEGSEPLVVDPEVKKKE
ncbi:hypothetical protein HK097_001842 [Rhizophlyctis rosea]|uniref:Uncharacterized protein n=1 Tax=Rhizophlyctis rosea TaxID=64517 RepID=A0AAD5X6R1_9FUNG|nr:hypothetical protein HK097_001842 [Rhizophlyctis rosea]